MWKNLNYSVSLLAGHKKLCQIHTSLQAGVLLKPIFRDHESFWSCSSGLVYDILYYYYYILWYIIYYDYDILRYITIYYDILRCIRSCYPCWYDRTYFEPGLCRLCLHAFKIRWVLSWFGLLLWLLSLQVCVCSSALLDSCWPGCLLLALPKDAQNMLAQERPCWVEGIEAAKICCENQDYLEDGKNM